MTYFLVWLGTTNKIIKYKQLIKMTKMSNLVKVTRIYNLLKVTRMLIV